MRAHRAAQEAAATRLEQARRAHEAALRADREAAPVASADPEPVSLPRAAAVAIPATAAAQTAPVAGGVTETEEDDATEAPGEDASAGDSEDSGEDAAAPTPFSMGRHGMPAPLRGSLAVLERQDARLIADGLERIQDEADLSARIQNHLLVPLPASDALLVNDSLTLHHRYCRPWTARFLRDLAHAHEATFRRPLQVNSAVRTVSYQRHLMRVNGNAAPAVGELVSPHLMGATIDIGKRGMSRSEIAWMRMHLLALEQAGKIDVEEEFHQACFHITVYRSYLPSQRRSIETRTVTRPRHGDEAQPVAEADAQGG